MDRTAPIPKSQRFTFGQTLDRMTLDAVLRGTRAAFTREKAVKTQELVELGLLHRSNQLPVVTFQFLRCAVAFAIVNNVRRRDDYSDRSWRKSRLAARILLRKADGRMTERDRRLAKRLGQDNEVTDRLIQQGLYFLGIGERKHEFDRCLGLVEAKS